MGFWEFMTVLVVFSSVFGYLRSRHVSGDKERLATLEQRVQELEGGRKPEDLEKRLEVLEEIVVGEDHDLERRIAKLETP